MTSRCQVVMDALKKTILLFMKRLQKKRYNSGPVFGYDFESSDDPGKLCRRSTVKEKPARCFQGHQNQAVRDTERESKCLLLSNLVKHGGLSVSAQVC